MDQLFVTPSGNLRERWKKAFPRALVVPTVAAIAEASNSARAVIWLDISVMNADNLMTDIREAVAFGWPVVAMSATPTETEAFEVLNTGVSGYCHVEAAPEQLREIGLVVEHSGIWMPPELMQRLLKLSMRVVATEVPVENELNDLTARELMVAEQIAHGASNREIAERLEITERTVKAHLSAIFEKMGVRDRVQLALAMNHIPTHTTVN
ncbi:MAG: response regulator transcription factor [Halioglobus sp.]